MEPCGHSQAGWGRTAAYKQVADILYVQVCRFALYPSVSALPVQNLDVTSSHVSHAPSQSQRERGLDTGQVCYHAAILKFANVCVIPVYFEATSVLDTPLTRSYLRPCSFLNAF